MRRSLIPVLLIVLGLLLIAAYLLLSGALPDEDETRPSPLADRGYAGKPLVVTEFGILPPSDYGFPPGIISEFMLDAFDFLAGASGETGLAEDDNRLFQHRFWYSVFDDGDFPTGNLCDGPQGALTAIGRAYRACLSGE